LGRSVTFLEAYVESRRRSSGPRGVIPCLRNIGMFLKPGAENLNKNHLVSPTGFDRTCVIQIRDFVTRRYGGQPALRAYLEGVLSFSFKLSGTFASSFDAAVRT